MTLVTALTLGGCIDLDPSSDPPSSDEVSSPTDAPDQQAASSDEAQADVEHSQPAPTNPENLRLGLHVTTDELAIWRNRAQGQDRVDGKPTSYVSQGDVILNSPGDWDRIISLKNKFVANPSRYVWQGPTHNWPNAILNNSSWPMNQAGMPPTRDNAQAAEPIRDAAFFAMVLGSEAVPDTAISISSRDAILDDVKDVIQQIIRSKHNDYSNTQRYNRNKLGTGFHPSYQIAAWLNRLIYAYDYAQIANPSTWTVEERKEFISWLNEASEWWAAIIEKRRSGMFKTDGSPTARADEPSKEVIWAGGPQAEKVHARVDNHVSRLAGVPTFAGLLAELEQKRSGVTTLNDDRVTELVDYGRQSVEDYLVAEFIPSQNGTGGSERSGGGNMFRWPGDTGPTEGWKYAMEHLGHNVMLADHIARAGDTSPYEHATTKGTSTSRGTLPEDGLYGAGGPKNLRAAVERMWSYIDENSGPPRYGCKNCSDERHRYDSVDDLKGYGRANEWESIQGNIYFRSDFLESIYMRERQGTPDLPESPKSAQGYIENGDSSAYPGANFMFAQMEGRVWPYAAD